MSSNVRQAVLTWSHDLVFDGGAPDGPTIRLDGDGATAPSPVMGLLIAAAACSGADVVLILKKMRVELERFRIEAKGTRREADPRRLTGLHLVYALSGTGLDEGKARRAIELSIQKYCSVMHSLAPDIPVTFTVVLE
ncbi:MAG TPA: OsmC family protein [Gemmatimonadales bacterium]|nr:OsmC family protein [Gemmatimonadales bacterium]